MYNDVSQLIGRTLTEVRQEGKEAIYFTAENNDKWQMVYHQDCCGSATIEDVIGDLQDLVGSPITMAECVTHSNENPPELILEERLTGIELGHGESFTWTFYKFATVKGYVTIRWLGESNGYYSEEATFEKVQ